MTRWRPDHCVRLTLLATLIAGCAGPRPAPPVDAAVTAPARWRAAIADRATGNEAVSPQWWQAYGDPVLVQLVQSALAHNTDLEIAAARVEQSRAQFTLAGAQRWPRLDLGAGAMRERDVNAFGEPEVQTASQAKLSISYDADLFGRLAASSAAARDTLLASEYGRDNLRLSIVAATVNGYLGLRSLDAKLDLLKQTLAARQESLKFAHRRASAGYASNLDLHQAEAELHATEQLIPATELAIRRTENGLSLLLGQAPGAIERGKPLQDLLTPSVPVGLPSELLRRRPDIAQAERQLSAADHQLDAARAAFMPSVTLTANGGYVDSTLLDDPIRVFSLGGSILAPLLDAGRLKAQQQATAARRNEAAWAYRKTTLTAFGEVEDALAALSMTHLQEQALRDQQSAVAKALKLATRRYRAGYSPYLEQLDAQRSLLSVDMAVLQAHTDVLTDTVTLYQALGGGWQMPDT